MMGEEQLGAEFMKKTWLIQSDTTALNTSCIQGINVKLQAHVQQNFQHEVHAVQCEFHINELFLGKVIIKIEGKSQGPGAFSIESALTK